MHQHMLVIDKADPHLMDRFARLDWRTISHIEHAGLSVLQPAFDLIESIVTGITRHLDAASVQLMPTHVRVGVGSSQCRSIHNYKLY